ncbi:MAG TPA: hypothetical protein VM686_04265 [Polyangiaceae bacterium]|nr:hypothetical protein [Polyangiaceae bacterium]
MRWLYVFLVPSVLASACSTGSGTSKPGHGSGSSSNGATGSGGTIALGGSSSIDLPAGGQADTGLTITSIRLDPPDAVLDVGFGETGSQNYAVFASIDGGEEEDITERAVFDVPDNWRIGTFPDATQPEFQTAAEEPRGGVLTVRATAANGDGTTTSATTSLTVRFGGDATDPREVFGSAGLPLPADPESLFGGSEQATRAPSIVYPPDGAMMPPNVGRLDVHFLPGSASNTVFEVAIDGPAVALRYYVRCGTAVEGGCILPLDEQGTRYVTQGNRGTDGVTITVRGTDDTGSAFGTSEPVKLLFSDSEVQGAVYYWAIVAAIGTGRFNSSIMRFDFGNPASVPEQFIALGQGSSCVGCHTLSRDGTKLGALFGGNSGGGLVYAPDLTKQPTDPSLLAVNNDQTQGVHFSSFSPTGDRFVGINGGGTGSDSGATNLLYFHDGATGQRLAAETLTLPVEPNHPDWSPDGSTIAFSVVGQHTNSQKPKGCGLSLIRNDGSSWSTTPEELFAPNQNDVVRYAPAFVPDSSLLLYNEARCSEDTAFGVPDPCDADDDPSAKVWAMRPEAGAAPVLLANASKPGPMDGANTAFADTFPRIAPSESHHQGKRLYWVTIGSHRRAGLLNYGPTVDVWAPFKSRKLVWMFAIDPDRVLAGEDGSYPGFFLPIQYSPANAAAPLPEESEDVRSLGLVKTSNHLAQWTAGIVSDLPPPPPDPPPPPPDPPPPVPR